MSQNELNLSESVPENFSIQCSEPTVVKNDSCCSILSIVLTTFILLVALGSVSTVFLVIYKPEYKMMLVDSIMGEDKPKVSIPEGTKVIYKR